MSEPKTLSPADRVRQLEAELEEARIALAREEQSKEATLAFLDAMEEGTYVASFAREFIKPAMKDEDGIQIIDFEDGLFKESGGELIRGVFAAMGCEFKFTIEHAGFCE